MKLDLKPLFLLTFLLIPHLAQASACGLELVAVQNANALESNAACTSLAKVFAYFQAMGATVAEPKITIVFETQVYLPGPEPRTPVHGYFDTDDHSIHITHFDSASQKERMPWGLVWSEAMAESFLLHEISHLFAISYMGDAFRELPHFWQEFLAYSIQIELMEPGLKQRLLQFSGGAKAFDNPESVTSFHYQMDPEGYALRSYLSYAAWGGPKFLKDLIDLKIPATRKPSL